jgi:hypothetical protein
MTTMVQPRYMRISSTKHIGPTTRPRMRESRSEWEVVVVVCRVVVDGTTLLLHQRSPPSVVVGVITVSILGGVIGEN